TLIAALIAWVPAGLWLEGDLDTGFAPLRAFFWANLIVLCLNLLPYRTQTAGVQVASDGLHLLTLPFASPSAVRQLHALYFAMGGGEYLKAKQYAEAAAWYERGLACHPDDLYNRANLGATLLNAGQFARAREACLPLLAREDLDPTVRAIVLINIACADVLIDAAPAEAADLLAEADRFSAEVLQSIPWLPHAKGTRGDVLVALGRPDEGIPLLEEAMRDHETADDKAFCACFLAIGEARRRRPDQARAYLEAARQLDPACIILEKAEKELRAGPVLL